MRNFTEAFGAVAGGAPGRRAALVGVDDTALQRAVAAASREGLLIPIHIGERETIQSRARAIGFEVADGDILDADGPEAAAALGIGLVCEGRADILVKGEMDSGDFFTKQVKKKHKGLLAGGTLSHISALEVPSYHKLLFCTDTRLLAYPTLPQKSALVANAVGFLHRMGYSSPKVCALTSQAWVNPKVPETVEAAALQELNMNGNLNGCVIEGPLSLDLAVSKEAAQRRGYGGECAGDADLLVVPNIHAGSILEEALVQMAGAKATGLVLGARCPIVLAPRRGTQEESYHSLTMALAACET